MGAEDGLGRGRPHSYQGVQMIKSVSTAALRPIDGLEGPKDLRVEEYREYDFGGRTYRINNPVAFYYRNGGQ